MASWTIEDLRKLDRKFAEAGIALHTRPFRAAMELLGPAFRLGVGGNPEVHRIASAYEAMVPEVRTSWPGMGTGVVVSVDQVRKFVMPVVWGQQRLEIWRSLGFGNLHEWWRWCREDQIIAAESYFAVGDLFDFTYGLDDLRGTSSEAETLWRMAASNLGDIANALPTVFSVDSIIQPICMIAELSLKGALVFNGAEPAEFMGSNGHDLLALASRVGRETPHRDDALVQTAITALPRYVKSRYAPAGLTRLRVTRLALAVQFVAASTVRRLSTRDLSLEMETGEYPGPRSPLLQ